jgi:putative FmdB family regulatory protein
MDASGFQKINTDMVDSSPSWDYCTFITFSVNLFLQLFDFQRYIEVTSMPVYEYECSACNNVFEVQQKISEAPLTQCSQCGGSVKKLVSSSAFHLKGGGWYSDGYSSGGKKEGEASPPSPPSPPCQGGGTCGSCPAAA